MKLSSFHFLSVLLIPAVVSAADPVLLQKVAGTVEIKASPDASWAQAKPGAQLPSGGSVRTGADGRAELKFKNKTSVWLKPSTNVAVEQKGEKNNRVVLASGSLKIRVPHLGFREKFEVKTPMAVASVRGTVFTVDEGKVQTLFGQVKMLLDNGKKFDVPQGTGFDGKGVSLLSHLEEAAGMEDWTPGLTDQQRVQGMQDFVNNRQQIRDYAHDALARNQELVDALTSGVKQDDFAAGRTLTDVHGNLVRVEQRLDRPDDHTIEVLNVTLRQSYAAGLRHFHYNGVNESRVDALIAKTVFNQALPTSINEFPGFFNAHSDVKVDHVSFVAANMADPQDIATLAFLGDRNPSSGTDQITSNLYIGGVTGTTPADARKTLFNLDTSHTGGLTEYFEDTGADTINFKGTGGELYGATAKRFLPASGGSAVWVCSENYVINNAGGVRNVADYTSSGANIQGLLGNSAAESVVFVKADAANSGGDSRHQFTFNDASDILPGERNIDSVVIPDLFLSIVKSLGTSAGAFKTTY